jgi:hypothetical protein
MRSFAGEIWLVLDVTMAIGLLGGKTRFRSLQQCQDAGRK